MAGYSWLWPEVRRRSAPMRNISVAAIVLLLASFAAAEDSDVKKAVFPSVDQLAATAELPDPFLRPCLPRVGTKDEWARQRNELLAAVLHYEYGPLPPVPKKINARELPVKEPQPAFGTVKQFLMTMGPNNAIQTHLFLTIPNAAFKKGRFPIVVTGDLGW